MIDHETEQITLSGQSRSNEGLDGLLLPCAHCGGTAGMHQQKNDDGTLGGYFIECGNPSCWMTTPLKFALMDDAAPLLAEIWNRRTATPNVEVSSGITSPDKSA